MPCLPRQQADVGKGKSSEDLTRARGSASKAGKLVLLVGGLSSSPQDMLSVLMSLQLAWIHESKVEPTTPFTT